MEISAVLRAPLSPVSQAGGQVVYPHLELWCLQTECQVYHKISQKGANNNNRSSAGVCRIGQAKLSPLG